MQFFQGPGVWKRVVGKNVGHASSLSSSGANRLEACPTLLPLACAPNQRAATPVVISFASVRRTTMSASVRVVSLALPVSFHTLQIN